MNRSLTLLLGVVLLVGVGFPAASAASGPPSSSGSVAYSVQVMANGTLHTYSLNESVAPSSTEGDSVATIAMASATSNFTYSHVVNSSSVAFPYVPAISNRTISYGNSSYTLQATLEQQPSTQTTFQGKVYTMTNLEYTASFWASKAARGGQVNGSISAFPSGLVYSVTAQGNSTQVKITLTSTSLPLDAGNATPVVQTTSAGVGISAAIGAVALSLGIRMRRNHRSGVASKPDHWVD